MYMDSLRLGGHEVYPSYLTQEAHNAVCADILLKVTRKNKNKALAAFKKTGAYSGPWRGLRISGIADLSFLQDFPGLLYLEIRDQRNVSTRDLAGLSNLRGLHLEMPGAGIDFACFPLLEVFSGDWHKDNRNIIRCRELYSLSTWHFNPPSRDLTEFANLPRLENLFVAQTNIATLDGLETLEDLRYLTIAYASKLESLIAMSRRECGIRELHFDKVKKITSYEPLGSLRMLRTLQLSGCAPMNNLKWTTNLSRLDFFSFVETNVVDGDLSPLLRLPSLRKVGTFDKKHYNYKSDAIDEILAARNPQ